MEERAWTAADWDCVCGPRYQLAWMMQSNLIKKLNSLAAKVVCKKGKEGESSLVLVVAPYLECGGGIMGGSGLGLCLWVKISTGSWII